MDQTKILDKVSGGFFFGGAVLSKLQYLPFPIAAEVIRFLSLGLYAVGYIAWFASVYFKKGQEVQEKEKWYGFAKIKEQIMLSSLLGLAGTLLSIAAISIPVLFPPAAGFYFLGNIVWAISEYHKLKNPPADDNNYSSTRQKAFVSYAFTLSAISSVAFTSSILMIIFPLATIPVTVCSLLLCAGLGAFALENWLNANFGAHQPSPPQSSYQNQMADLGQSTSSQEKPDPEPTAHYDRLFAPRKQEPKDEIKMDSIQPENKDNSHVIPCEAMDLPAVAGISGK